ncbi:MAG: aspartyl/asparaginyl beta-hydroxylase domain-containing protein [Crocinitomicaceae bacterium]
MKKSKLWFSLFDFSFDYKGDEPSFIEESFTWSQEFEQNRLIVKDELNLYLKEHHVEAYFNKTMVNADDSWKTFSLKWWDIQFHSRHNYFPKTMAIVNKYPEIVSVSFNQLEPNGKILPHCGDTNAIFRCHLGIEIPESLPKTGLRVRDELKSWEEGKWLIFMDAYQHEAFNLSDRRRIILVLDVLRPEFSSKRKVVIAVVLTSLFLQKRAQRFKVLYKLPQWIIKLIVIPLCPLAYIKMRMVNFFKVY